MSDYDDLWGEIDLSSVEKSPVELLKQQAAVIAPKTNDILIGEIETTTDEEVIYNTLYIIAPKIENYRYALLKTASTSRPYPVFVYDNSQDSNAIKVKQPRKVITNPFGMNPALLMMEQLRNTIGTFEKVEYVGKSIPEPDYRASSFKEFEKIISNILSSKDAISVIHSLLAQSK
jgi:hypothetical protein